MGHRCPQGQYGEPHDRMEDYLSDVLDVDDPTLRYDFDKSNSDTGLKIAPDVRQKVYLIFKEAVNNAVKHSNGGHLDVNLKSTSAELFLNISDDGTVNPDQIKSSGLGLSNMKMSAERIVARFQIDWATGAKVILNVSLRR